MEYQRQSPWLVRWLAVGAAVAVVAASYWRDSQTAVSRPQPPDMIGSLHAPVSSAAGLSARIAAMEERIAKDPNDAAAAVVLAEALVRQARVTGNAAHAARAEQRLREALTIDPGNYDAARLLGVVLLSLHKFQEAVAAGERAERLRPDDAFNNGVIGDGLLELGKYPEALAAFQCMMDMRPTAAAYARAAYALELQGQLERALETMQRAVNATSPRDAEGLAWAMAQVGDLLLRLDRVPEATAEYRLAAAVFPDHPFPLMGLARVHAALGQDDEAIRIASSVMTRAPSIALAAFIGDLHARNQRLQDAERAYATAEAIGRGSASSDDSYAGFLAERGRRPLEAVRLAEQAAAGRQDLRTLDALGWSYFRAGRLADAERAADRALATGTREKHIVLHAAAIKAALGDAAAARTLAARAAPRDPDFDVLSVEQVTSLVADPRPPLRLTAGVAR
jgi:tetratricopeptide (TPR) repeat protein